jgi:hypothetical protein
MSVPPASVNTLPARKSLRPAEMAEGTWADAYVLNHRQLGLDMSLERARKRMLARERRHRQVAEGIAQPTTANDAVMVQIISEHRKSRAALVRLRFDIGFRHPGGPVAGNPSYQRPAFVHKGLISNEHPALLLFVAKVPRAKRLRIGDTKGESFTTDSKLLALDAPYIEGNKACAGFVRVDMDGAFTWMEIEAICQEAYIPLPNIAVGYQDGCGRVLSPHLIWMLAASVPMANNDLCKRFRCLYHGVARGLVKALLPHGADPGGLLNAHRVKNPLSPLWDRRVLADEPYDLGFIKEHVDCTVGRHALERRHAALHGEGIAAISDHPDPSTATQSNRFFYELARWARKAIGKARSAHVQEQEFAALVALEACDLAARMTGDAERCEHAALAVARTVSKWTWYTYKGRKSVRITKNAEELKERNAEGGKKAAAKRKQSSHDIILSAVRRLSSNIGRCPTQAEVLAEARGPGITNIKTVKRHWSSVLAGLA